MCVCPCMLNCSSPVSLFVTPWTIAHQAPLFMGFSRKEYWNGLPCSPPRELPDPGITPESPAFSASQVDSLLLSHRGSPPVCVLIFNKSLFKKQKNSGPQLYIIIPRNPSAK